MRDGAPVVADISVLDNIKLGRQPATLHGSDPRSWQSLWSTFPALEDMQRRTAGLLSGGRRQMPAATACAAIGALRQAGLCVLLAEQNTEWLEGITSRSLELESGRMVTVPYGVA